MNSDSDSDSDYDLRDFPTTVEIPGGIHTKLARIEGLMPGKLSTENIL